MKLEDFDLFATLAKQRAGLALAREKAYLLEARLLNVSRKYNLKSLTDMAQLVRSRRDEGMMNDIAEAISLHESNFFDNRKSFAQIRKFILPQLLKARAAKRHIRIWSAATCSGQEAYSLAMMCAEATALVGWKVEIVGTDLSHDMIDRAKSGVFNHFDVQRGLPITMLLKYFHQIAPDKWQVNDTLRRMVEFRHASLLQDFSAMGVFDIICCQNVLADFDALTRTHVLQALGKSLAPDGVFVIGSAGIVQGIPDVFAPMEERWGLYQLSSSQGCRAQTAVS